MAAYMLPSVCPNTAIQAGMPSGVMCLWFAVLVAAWMMRGRLWLHACNRKIQACLHPPLACMPSYLALAWGWRKARIASMQCTGKVASLRWHRTACCNTEPLCKAPLWQIGSTGSIKRSVLRSRACIACLTSYRHSGEAPSYSQVFPLGSPTQQTPEPSC